MLKRKLVKLPKKIHRVLRNPNTFDYLYLEMLREYPAEEAYEMAIKSVRRFVPDFTPYKNYNSYRSVQYNRNDKAVEVPQYIIDAVTGGFDDLFHHKLKFHTMRKKAYDSAVNEIQKYFKGWKPYSSYNSFRSAMTAQHKKRVSNLKKK